MSTHATRVRRLPNEFMNRMSHPSRKPTPSSEFSDEELVAIQLMAESWQSELVRPEVVHDLGAHEFGKVVRGILAKMGQ